MAKPEPTHERSFRFALDILRFYRIVISTTDVPRHLSTQMLRSGTAIGANLEEGKSDECNQLIAILTTIVRKLRIERIGRAAAAAGTAVIAVFLLSNFLSNFWLLTSNLS